MVETHNISCLRQRDLKRMVCGSVLDDTAWWVGVLYSQIGWVCLFDALPFLLPSGKVKLACSFGCDSATQCNVSYFVVSLLAFERIPRFVISFNAGMFLSLSFSFHC